MWITGILATVFLLKTACVASVHQLSYAWWVTARFEPRDERIEGIPLAQLGSDWLRASVVRASALPPQAREQDESLRDHGFDLIVEADMDGDSRPERAVVGVFQTNSGGTGRFLLVLGRRDGNEPWRKRAVFTIPGEPGFSAIALRDGRLQWVTCLECDTGCEVVRGAGRFRLQCQLLL